MHRERPPAERGIPAESQWVRRVSQGLVGLGLLVGVEQLATRVLPAPLGAEIDAVSFSALPVVTLAVVLVIIPTVVVLIRTHPPAVKGWGYRMFLLGLGLIVPIMLMFPLLFLVPSLVTYGRPAPNFLVVIIGLGGVGAGMLVLGGIVLLGEMVWALARQEKARRAE